MTNERINPWAGLASYEDPAKSERKLKFCGRDNDIYDVARLIDDNLLLILYGKSGIGKTSLLNAGVFPRLRQEQYLPVSIRLGTLEADASYQEAVVEAIESAIEEVQGSITIFNVVEEQNDDLQPERLWNYFARHRFANAEGLPLFPVVVLDQFEEVLRNANAEHVKKAQTLLNQIQYLIDESHALNDCVVDGKEYYYDFNFRFVISIREDELYLLEDNIDDLSLSMFRNCRYRLRSLSDQGATEAILVPGRDCIAEEQKQDVVGRVIALSKRPQSNDIDTLLLSLVCSGTYDKKAGEKITLSDLAIWKSNPMEVYYQDAVKGLPADHVRYIQQHLIREDGSRRRVDAEEVKAALGEATYHQLTLGANRLLTLGDKGQVELLHDQLGLAVYEERKAFEERERKKRLRRRVTVIGIIILAIAGIFFFQNHRLKQQRWRMMENQSRFIAEKAIELVNKGDAYTAQRLMLEVLPKDLKQPDRPFTVEAGKALRYSFSPNIGLYRGNSTGYSSATYSPDGKYILSVSWSTISIWDVKTGQELMVLYGHTTKINTASYSPDGRYIVTASSDCTVRIWEAKSGLELRKLDHSSAVRSANYGPDGKHIVSATGDGEIIIWDAETGIELRKLEGHVDGVNSACYSPDGKRIVSASYDGTIRMWDAEAGKEIRKLEGHTQSVYMANYSPDGKYIVSASRDEIRIWDAETGNELLKLKQEYDVNSAIYSPDGNYVLSASDDETIRVWDVKTGKEIRKLRGHTGSVEMANYSPDGNYILSASDDGTIRIWDNDSFFESREIKLKPYMRSINYSSNGKYLVASSYYGIIEILDAETFNEINKLTGEGFDFGPVNYSPNGKYIVSASLLGKIYIYDVETGLKLKTLGGHKNDVNYVNYVNSLCFSPDNKYIVSASDDYTVRIWEVESGIELRKLKHSFAVRSANYSPNGKQIVSATGDEEIIIWDAETGIELRKLEGHVAGVNSACYSPDGRRIVSASDDETVRIWCAETGNVIKVLKGHDYPVESACYSLDGKYIISASRDAIVWDAQNGCELHKYYRSDYDGFKFEIALFSPNGSNIVLLDRNGTIHILPFPPLQDLIDLTRERFKDRPLTQEERKMYYLEK